MLTPEYYKAIDEDAAHPQGNESKQRQGKSIVVEEFVKDTVDSTVKAVPAILNAGSLATSDKKILQYRRTTTVFTASTRDLCDLVGEVDVVNILTEAFRQLCECAPERRSAQSTQSTNRCDGPPEHEGQSTFF